MLNAPAGAMVGDGPTDHLVLVGLAGELEVLFVRFHADSTASPPPEVKKTQLRSPGARLARRSASSIAGMGVGPDRGARVRACSAAAWEFLAPVPELRGEQPGEPVEIAPLVVPDVRPLTAHDDRARARRGCTPNAG